MLAAAPIESSAERKLRAVEWALRLGDLERAFDLAQEVGRQGETFEAAWALGRAARARGDTTMAGVALDKARALSPCAAARTKIDVERAEVRYQAGRFEE